MPPGSIVLSTRAPIGHLAIAGVPMAFNQGCRALVPRPGTESRFLFYSISASTSALQVEGRGSTFTELSGQQLAEFGIDLPGQKAQNLIADFLDRETERIDALVDSKRRLIDLLAEKRTALITHAVTKGLDPTVPMKDSGIPWIGEIPAHWEVLPIRALARPGTNTFIDGDWVELPHITDEGIRLLQTGNIGVGEFREQGFRYISNRSFVELRCTEVEPGDVLICRLAEPVGRACVAPDLGLRMITSVDVAILKTAATVEPQFIVGLLSSHRYLSFVESEARGGTRSRVSRSWLGRVRLPIPPPHEQREIATWLARRRSRAARASQALRSQLHLLAEYRQAVITAAVTGQLDEETLRGREPADEALGVEVPS